MILFSKRGFMKEVGQVVLWVLCLSLFRQCLGVIDVPRRRNVTYTWRPGAWGSCFSPHKCGDGQKERAIMCTDSDGLIVSKEKCPSSTKPTFVQDCFKVCEMHKNSLRWLSGPWSSCQRNLSETSCSDSTGVSTREVSCVYSRRRVEDSACEYFERRPDTSMLCTLDCPQDCVVSNFSDWTECGPCANRVRTRTVLVAPSEGGRACPDLSEMSTCEVQAACPEKPSERYFLRMGHWGECVPSGTIDSTNRQPVVGHRVRNVTCVQENGHPVHISFCISHGDHKSQHIKTCIVSEDCSVSPWSEWTVEQEGCIDSFGHVVPEVRTRSRQLYHLAEGEGQPCPPLLDKRIITSDLRTCKRFHWITSEWSECNLYHEKADSVKSECGGGIQNRNITCLNSLDLIPVSSKFCKELPPVIFQQCNIECPVHCIVSEWSDWSPCIPYVVQDIFILPKEGYVKRRRSVLQHPNSNGAECPAIQEVDLCSGPEVVKWKFTEWGPCELFDIEKGCGNGLQKRDAMCTKLDGTSASDGLCELHDNDDYPEDITTTECYVACPGDCVLSQWSNWSPCSIKCADGKNKYGSTFRNRTILSLPSPGNERCSNELKEADDCNLDSCNGFMWKAEPWGKCQPFENKTCGSGIQTRNVNCILENRRIVSKRKCKPALPLPSERACAVPCPKDCVTTNFSEWSSCPDTCNSDVEQIHERFILEMPKNGGKSCPVLKEARMCSPKSDLSCIRNAAGFSLSFQWNVSEWSSCTLGMDLECGSGYQTRSVRCLQSDGRETELFRCLEKSSNIDQLINIPSSYRKCYIYCDSRCQVSQWSEWSSCKQCSHFSLRTRELLGGSEGKNDCLKKFPTEERKKCLIEEPFSQSHQEWLDCILSEDTVSSNGGILTQMCGSGFKYRIGNELDFNSCLNTGLEKEICIVECPIDCQMSDWSLWQPCSVTCGVGYRQRERRILTVDQFGGRPCPKTENEIEIQRTLCSSYCSQYVWVTHGWSECDIHSKYLKKQCGSGTQTRKVSCMDNSTNYVEVKDEFCDLLLKPDAQRTCTVYCPDDCVVSNWSPWSQCFQPCDSNQMHYRTRNVLRKSQKDGKQCPSLEEEEPCILNTSCFQYSIVFGNWTSCILPDGVTCGEGYQNRSQLCIRSDNQQVHLSFCSKVEMSEDMKEKLIKNCSVDCPIDCLVSKWSEWDSSKCKPCQSANFMTRFQTITQPASSTGRPCPKILTQSKPCSYVPCYYWKVSEWSSCDLQNGNCGFGIRRREVKCLNSHGESVSKVYCLHHNLTSFLQGWVGSDWLSVSHDYKDEEMCYVSCPGDCLITEWSEWSYCHRNCTNGQIVGYETSSRSILSYPHNSNDKCPETLWRTRPCSGGPCYTFEWKVLNGLVNCLRSDGILVEGGCQQKLRPCFPSCLQPHALCNHTSGKCECEPGFVAIWEQSTLPSSSESDAEWISDPGEKIRRCEMLGTMDPGSHANHSAATTEQILLKYYPDDSEASFWMYAMISIGSAFVIFVFVTVYLMCTPERD